MQTTAKGEVDVASYTGVRGVGLPLTYLPLLTPCGLVASRQPYLFISVYSPSLSLSPPLSLSLSSPLSLPLLTSASTLTNPLASAPSLSL